MKTTLPARHVMLSALVLLGACSRATTAVVEARVDQAVELGLGEAARVEGSAVTVRFSAANDSRCPSDVTCVTAGDAAITLLLSGAGAERTDVVYLGREPKATTYGAFRFEAVGLAPYPRSQGQGADKTLTLRVTRTP